VEVVDPGGLAATADHLGAAAVGHGRSALRAEPQGGLALACVAAAGAQVAVHSGGGFDPVGGRSVAAGPCRARWRRQVGEERLDVRLADLGEVVHIRWLRRGRAAVWRCRRRRGWCWPPDCGPAWRAPRMPPGGPELRCRRAGQPSGGGCHPPDQRSAEVCRGCGKTKPLVRGNFGSAAAPSAAPPTSLTRPGLRSIGDHPVPLAMHRDMCLWAAPHIKIQSRTGNEVPNGGWPRPRLG
jgi:hypothetical protein